MPERNENPLPPRLRSRISYRAGNETKWREGESLRFGPSSILFLSEDLLEVGTEVTIVLAAKILDQGCDVPVRVCCKAQITGRTLANWPEVLPAAVAKIVDVEFVPQAPEPPEHLSTSKAKPWFKVDLA